MNTIVHFTDLHAHALQVIAGARKRLLLASYATPSSEILERIGERRHTLTDTRILLNSQTSKACLGLPVRYFDRAAAMHHKFIVADDTVLMGSYNFSRSGVHDCIAILHDKSTAKRFESEFDSMWALGTDTRTTYSVDDLRRLLEAVVKGQGRWLPFTTSLSRTLSAHKSLSAGQINALRLSHLRLFGTPFQSSASPDLSDVFDDLLDSPDLI